MYWWVPLPTQYEYSVVSGLFVEKCFLSLVDFILHLCQKLFNLKCEDLIPGLSIVE